MANTFKFGNGNWAVKDGSALAYNDENNNFKPLPFDFTRASSATTLNRQGLIETVPSGKPRIDFLNNTDGHLLLEPSRTNYVTYSAEGDYGNNPASESNTIAPDGTNTAVIPVPDSNSDRYNYTFSGLDYSTNTKLTYSWFRKRISTPTSTAYLGDLQPNVLVNVTQVGSTIQIGSNINGYDRFSATFNVTDGSLSGIIRLYFGLIIGIGNSSIAYWGHQLEEGSYATSYIPTEGSSVTRVVDDIALTVPDVDSFNSSSGFSVIAKFDIGAPNLSSSVPFLFFNDDSSDTYIGFGTNATNLRCRLNLSGTSYLNTQGNAPRTQRNSLFISCNSSGWSQGANGSTNHTGTNNASVFDRLASITFFTSETYGIIKISELLVYNTRLSNTELQNLTS